ncbi:hypothetical protein GN244_ATG15303 [Phytophthora infestans]|uniref:Uncharacterized protein n=1 Tax=Phytophthora infestans TaxID=4787 RepID=A0A833W7Q6_PHYIN|nr:hypothetical protein GN244_ATG15303 [Phytophthora infestans]
MVAGKGLVDMVDGSWHSDSILDVEGSGLCSLLLAAAFELGVVSGSWRWDYNRDPKGCYESLQMSALTPGVAQGLEEKVLIVALNVE